MTRFPPATSLGEEAKERPGVGGGGVGGKDWALDQGRKAKGNSCLPGHDGGPRAGDKMLITQK